jgi:hypothetical protein
MTKAETAYALMQSERNGELGYVFREVQSSMITDAEMSPGARPK